MDNNEIYVSLDIGTSNVKVIIGEMVNGHLNVIGVGNAESNGLKRGSIVDIDDTVQSIRKAISEAERMVGVQINRVIVGIGTNQVQLSPCKGVVAVASDNREITDNDVQRVIESARSVAIVPEREFIDVIPVQFIVDGLEEIKDPRGMIGVRLEMDGILVTGVKTMIHNLLRCVERAGLEITDICLQPLGAAEIALTKDEKNRGVALVDIGGGATCLSIFQSGTLKATTLLPIGGEHITKDISIVLQTSRDEAEQIKLKYGHAHYETASEEEVFQVENISQDESEEYSQLELAEIIEARLEEMLQLVQIETKKLGVRELPGGYVLTGGATKLPGMQSIAQQVLGGHVRIASPNNIGVREPQYTAGVGFIQYTCKKMKLNGENIPNHVQQEKQLERTPNYKVPKPEKVKKKDPEDSVGNKVKKFFRYLWE